MTNPYLVSTDWLAERLSDPAVLPIDGSWHLPDAGRSGRTEYLERHIPGAVFFDVDGISDPSSGLPHMLPSPHAFAEAVGALGITETKTLVIYDAAGLFSAPRVWWSLRTMGAETVYVLDGGLPKWLAEGRPIETGPSPRKAETFKARFDASAVKNADDVAKALDAGSAQVVDARSGARFRGEAPEPRPGLASGHMPGALNLPFSSLVRDGRLVEEADLRKAFEAAGVDVSKPILTTCGSGVTASVISFALEGLGASAAGLYDGSWSEWGAGGHPVATGPAKI